MRKMGLFPLSLSATLLAPPPAGKVANVGIRFPMLPVYHSEVPASPTFVPLACGIDCVLEAESSMGKKERQKRRTNPRGPKVKVSGCSLGPPLSLATQSREGSRLFMRARSRRGAHHFLLTPTGQNSVTYPIYLQERLQAGLPRLLERGSGVVDLWHHLCHVKQLVPENPGKVQKLETQHFGSPGCWAGLKTRGFAKSFIRYS